MVDGQSPATGAGTTTDIYLGTTSWFGHRWAAVTGSVGTGHGAYAHSAPFRLLPYCLVAPAERKRSVSSKSISNVTGSITTPYSVAA